MIRGVADLYQEGICTRVTGAIEYEVFAKMSFDETLDFTAEVFFLYFKRACEQQKPTKSHLFK